MTIIHQTLVTNKLNSGRTYRFLDTRGLYLGPRESKIIDGLYPSACRNPNSIKDLEACIDAGFIEIELITNLPVRRPTGGPNSVKIPEAVKAHSPEISLREKEGIELTTVEGGLHDTSKKTEDGAITIEVNTLETPKGDSPDARFEKTSIDSKRHKDVVMLPGHREETEIAQPLVKEMFGDPNDAPIDPIAYDEQARRASIAKTIEEAESAASEKAKVTAAKTASDKAANAAALEEVASAQKEAETAKAAVSETTPEKAEKAAPSAEAKEAEAPQAPKKRKRRGSSAA